MNIGWRKCEGCSLWYSNSDRHWTYRSTKECITFGILQRAFKKEKEMMLKNGTVEIQPGSGAVKITYNDGSSKYECGVKSVTRVESCELWVRGEVYFYEDNESSSCIHETGYERNTLTGVIRRKA